MTCEAASASNNLTCPACLGERITDIGPIPSAIEFAGRALSTPISGGRLFRCKSCHLGFKYPHLDKSALDRLYVSGADDTWSMVDASDRPDWAIAGTWIQSNSESGSVLDVGCFDGAFLSLLAGKYSLHGIEIHAGAAEVARRRGVSIVGNQFESVPRSIGPYNYVTCFDVIEHSEDPLKLITQLSALTSGGGHLLISSGNMDAKTWTQMRGRYWYCAIAEHISFISPAWIRVVAPRLGLSVVELIYFAHRRGSLGVKLSQSIKNVVYRVMPGFSAWLRVHDFVGHAPVRDWPELKHLPPTWDCATDHFMAILMKH